MAATAVFAASMYVGSVRDPANVPVLKKKTAGTARNWLAGLVPRFTIRLREQSHTYAWEELFYSLAFHLKAGETLPQALRGVSEEGADAPHETLRRVVRAYETGAPMMSALQSASQGGSEMHRLAAAVEIGLSTGSDLPVLLCHSAEILAKKRSLRKEARAKLAESRLTAALLSAMPWLIGAITYRYDPLLLIQAFAIPKGRAIVAASLALWLLGNVAILLTLASVARDKRG